MPATRFITATARIDMRHKPPHISYTLECDGETETITTTFRPARLGETPDERAVKMMAPRFKKTALGFVGILEDANDLFPDEEISDVVTEFGEAAKHYDSCADWLWGKQR